MTSRVRLRWCALVGFVVVGFVALGLPLSSGAAGPNAARATTGPTITITQQNFTVVGETTWRAVVETGEAPQDGLVLAVSSHRRLTSRAELTNSETGVLGAVLDRVVYDLAELERNDQGRVVLAVPLVSRVSTPADLLLGGTGLYPVTLELLQDASVVARTSTYVHHVTAEDLAAVSDAGSLRVMPVVTMSTPPALDDAGATRLDPGFATGVRNVVDAFTDSRVGAFLALPSDQLAALSATDPDLLGALGAQRDLHAFGATTFTPYQPSAMATAELGETFASQLRAGEDAVALALGLTPDRTTAVVTDGLTADGATLLRDTGTRGVVLTPRAAQLTGLADQLDSALTYRARATDGSTLLVQAIDGYLAAFLDDDTLTPLARAVRVASGLVLQRETLVAEGKDLNLVAAAVGTSSGEPANPQALRQLVRLVEANPALAMTASPRPGTTETSGDLVTLPDRDDTSLAEATTVMEALAPRINSTSSMLPETDGRAATWRLMHSTLASSTAGQALRAGLAASITDQTQAVRNAVTLPNTANFTLSGRESELRLQLRNSSDAPIRVDIRFRSAKLRFPEARQTVEIPPNASTEVRTLVEARSNGRFPVTVELLTPRGGVLLGSDTVTARVSALAGLGQVVTVVALLMLLTWWGHNWRVRRRKALESAIDTSGHPSRKTTTV